MTTNKKGKNIFNLDGRIFTALSNSDNGEVGNNTLFYYSQTDNIISADYHGGQIIKGNLIGKQLENGEFDFFYHHINSIGELKIGKCLSKAKMLDDGRLKLFEKWQWLCDDMSNGESELIEIINKNKENKMTLHEAIITVFKTNRWNDNCGNSPFYKLSEPIYKRR